MVSLAGLAVMRLPATVPRLRICGAPTSQHALASGKARSTHRRRAGHLVVSDQRSQVNQPVVPVQANRVQTRYPRYVNNNPGPANPALQLEDEIGAARDNARLGAMIGQQPQRFANG